MKRNAILLTIMMFVSKIFGFARETVMSYFYGRTPYADIYFTANLVPTVFMGFVAGGIAATFIPMYSRINHNDGEKRANEFMSNLLSILFIFGIVFAIFGIIFAEQLVNITAPGFDAEIKFIAKDFVRISLLTLTINANFTVLQSYHQYHERFMVSPLAGILMNLVTISLIFVSSMTKPIVLGISITVAALIQFLFTYIIARKHDFNFSPKIDLKDAYLEPMLKMAVPIILGSSINQVNTLIDRTFASNFGTGSIATLNYSSKISDSVYQLFVVTIVTVMYPTLTKQAAKGDYENLKNTVSTILNTVILIVIPASIGIMVLSQPIIQLFYGRGEFIKDPESVRITAQVMMLYAAGNIGYGVRDVLTRTFYALHDSITPVVSGLIAVVLNVIFNILFTKIFGLGGVALATSVSAMVSAILLYYQLYRKIDGIPVKKFLISTMKVLFASIVMGEGAYFTYALLADKMHYLLAMMIAVGVGVILYLVIMKFMKVEEYDEALLMIKRKFK